MPAKWIQCLMHVRSIEQDSYKSQLTLLDSKIQELENAISYLGVNMQKRLSEARAFIGQAVFPWQLQTSLHYINEMEQQKRNLAQQLHTLLQQKHKIQELFKKVAQQKKLLEKLYEKYSSAECYEQQHKEEILQNEMFLCNGDRRE